MVRKIRLGAHIEHNITNNGSFSWLQKQYNLVMRKTIQLGYEDSRQLVPLLISPSHLHTCSSCSNNSFFFHNNFPAYILFPPPTNFHPSYLLLF